MAALFGAMVILAAVPSVSVLTVVARSITSGWRQGVFTTLGIVVGDIVLIVFAICGLSVLVETMGSLFILVKYLGGAYLIGLGITLWRSTSTATDNTTDVKGVLATSGLSSFLTGLFVTLGDLKAILFYLGFFPAFVDLSTLSVVEVSIIIAIAAVAVGGVKLGYAFIAERASLLLHKPSAKSRINRLAGGVMMGIGIFLILKA